MVEVNITDTIMLGDGHPMLVVAGPCVIEGRCLCLDVAARLKELCEQLGLRLLDTRYSRFMGIFKHATYYLEHRIPHPPSLPTTSGRGRTSS